MIVTNRSRAYPIWLVRLMLTIKSLEAKIFSRYFCYSSIAQSVEHAAVNRGVVGSSPTGGVYMKKGLGLYLNPLCF